jgi:antitoxin MazE
VPSPSGHAERRQAFSLYEVDLLVEKDKIIIVPFKIKPRSGWETLFEEMSFRKDDKMIIPDSLDLNSKDWEW